MTNSRAILRLPIASIAIGERIGFYHAPHAERLGACIASDGQHAPIHVRRNGNAAKLPWTLVAGLHRLRGAGMAGLEAIDAIQVADANAAAIDLRRLELSENLDHRERRPIERAILMVERARIEEAADYGDRVGEASQVRAGKARQSAAITMMDADWRDRSATLLGCSVPTLERYQRIHRAIVDGLPDLAQALNFHHLGASLAAMTRLAQVPETGRRIVAEAVLADPDVQSIDAAMVAAKMSTSKGIRPAADNHEARFLRGWDRMKLSQKRGVAVEVATKVPPSIAADMIDAFRKRGLLP